MRLIIKIRQPRRHQVSFERSETDRHLAGATLERNAKQIRADLEFRDDSREPADVKLILVAQLDRIAALADSDDAGFDAGCKLSCPTLVPGKRDRVDLDIPQRYFVFWFEIHSCRKVIFRAVFEETQLQERYRNAPNS